LHHLFYLLKDNINFRPLMSTRMPQGHRLKWIRFQDHALSFRLADSQAYTLAACLLSVGKIVPTLTNKSAEIYLSMAGAKQHDDASLSWFRPWAVRPTGVRSGPCIALHRSACRGELQATRERRGSL
jgi:hypothetical protein